MLPPLAGIDGSQPPPTGHADDELYGSSVDVMAGVGELVQSAMGQWMVRPPLRYRRAPVAAGADAGRQHRLLVRAASDMVL